MTSPLSPRPGSTEEPRNWLVWSYEHDAWWREGSHGYTTALLGAGLYTETEAKHIAANASPRANSRRTARSEEAFSFADAWKVEGERMARTNGSVYEHLRNALSECDAQRAEIAELRAKLETRNGHA